ncbi:probable UGA2-succinate semialdehyde dehydrogenase [Sporisorium reilianum SRZ2]|uniref:Probable UGA2-succinate semialdehyde dehydrogenase n=2 Tax=Sporisorium reilianum TaxID=72558 RepID=E6ZS08_SPORE|nr:probable UGA2-succinate semialdehyde dehydrogenase [Sporisorium reilianum SRZ2]SJX65657.1 probable UGA2-succinate semialdehyde dehydrogenase [Sporisorium reilianum f. sp. reilianum]
MNTKLKDLSLLDASDFLKAPGSLDTSDNESFDVMDPGSGMPICRLKASNLKDVEQAIQAASQAFSTYSAIPARERATMLLNFDRLVRDNLEDLAWILVYETGKPFDEAKAEVQYALTFSWWYVGETERVQGQIVKSATNPSLRFLTVLQPIGPVAILTPWNFPVALFVRKAVSALAAGCTIVAKPSPETPLSTLAVANLLRRAGFPTGSVNIVLASYRNTPAIGQALCTDVRIKKLSFTGSTRVGRLLMQQCAPSLKKMTLELGGLGAYLVFEDADVEAAATALVANKLRHAGQTCISAQRTFVHESVVDRLLKSVAEQLDRVTIGHGAETSTTLGPLQTERSQQKAREHIQDAQAKGATVYVSKAAVPSSGYFVAPTLIAGCTKDMLVFQEESFAPIISVATFSTEQEAVELANDTDMGLTSYVFTKDSARLWRMFEQLKAGNVGLNVGGSTTAAEIPFGGVDQSGFGKEAGIGAGLKEYMIEKSATMSIA